MALSKLHLGDLRKGETTMEGQRIESHEKAKEGGEKRELGGGGVRGRVSGHINAYYTIMSVDGQMLIKHI